MSHESVTQKPASLFQQALGHHYQQLPAELQAFHAEQGVTHLEGQCTVIGAKTTLAKIVARLFSLPRASPPAPMRFELRATPTEESWLRLFPSRPMHSRLALEAGHLTERFGPVRLHFFLQADKSGLRMILKKLTIWGIPLPHFLLPTVLAEETASPGKLHFAAGASFPIVGLVAQYRGHLDVSALTSTLAGSLS